jgi:hypothetical protein
MKMNYKHFGSGVAISSNGLEYDYEALKRIIKERFTEYKSSNKV